MEKILDLLEKHCQWLAIALGGLFLAWTLSTYVLFAPVAVQAGGKTLGPGDVDDVVKVQSTDPLERELKDPNIPAPPKTASANINTQWNDEMAGKIEVATLHAGWPGSQTGDMKINRDEIKQGEVVKVQELPTLPPSQTVAVKAARALVGPAPAVAGVPGPDGVAPPPVAAPGGQPGVLPVTGRDLSYVRISYNLMHNKIAKAFADVKIPAAITSTSVIRVRLMRQELQADGKWGDPIEVPRIKNNAVIQQPPSGEAGPAIVNAFRAWAEGIGQSDLLRPIFYPVVSGEGPWDPAADELMPKYDPKAEQAKLQEAYKAKLEAERAKRAARPSAPPSPPRIPGGLGGPGGPGRGRRGPDSSSPAVIDPQRPAGLGDVAVRPFAQVRPPGYPGRPGPYGPGPYNPNMPGGPGGPPGGDPDGLTDPGMAPPAAVPGAGQPPADPLPAPNFQPAALAAPILGWTFDETVVEGHTYRYQIVYELRNPVYNSNIVSKPELASQFGIESKLDDNAWSQPVEVKPTAEFYLASTNWQETRIPGSVKVNVYKWAKGKWQMTPFTIAPGDKIGDEEAGVDYGTNATLVDIRYDPRAGTGRAYILLLTADGRLIEREPSTDLKNPRMFQLRQAVEQQKAADAAAQPTPPTGAPTANAG